MKDGGSAFPVLDTTQANNINSLTCLDGGMTLRDYFAGQALVGLLGGGGCWVIGDKKVDSPNLYALTAYAMADAMLAERGKGAKDERN